MGDLSPFLSQIKSEDSEELILAHLAKRAEKIFDENQSIFYQHLYRIDLNENDLNDFQSTMNFKALALCIWDRQKRKMKNWRRGVVK